MIEKTIVKLLLKISKQLEDISESQDKIRSEIFTLQKELDNYQTYTSHLENKLGKINSLRPTIN